MASIRPRPRADGTTAYVVLFRHEGRQSTLTFDTEIAAEAFRAAVEAHGPDRALSMHGIQPHLHRERERKALTVSQWVRRHIDGLTGVERYTLHKYEEYLRNDLAPRFGDLPLIQVDKAMLTEWVRHMQTSGGATATATRRRPWPTSSGSSPGYSTAPSPRV
ncbi:MAG TPA: hypothetical protein PLK19_17040 [Mycobacterium sp.]|nr:hypothetical protein [Mycobacterium sp.]